MQINQIKQVFKSVGKTVVECSTPSGAFLGYKVKCDCNPLGTGHRSLKSLEREAKHIAKRQKKAAKRGVA